MTQGRPRRTVFRLRIRDGEVRMLVGEHIIGRGQNCDVVLDDGRVSRQHARLVVSDSAVMLCDLGSVNGTFVNGRRIRGEQSLAPGDRIRLGGSELELSSAEEELEERKRDTVHGLAPVDPTMFGEEDIPTRRADGLGIAARGAEMAYAAGRPDQAERFLGGYLATVLAEIEDGRPLPDPTVLEAVRAGLRLAQMTRKGGWFDYCVKLLLAQQTLPPGQLMTELRGIGAELVVDRRLIERYEAEMVRQAGSLDGDDRKTLDLLSALREEIAIRG